jgi:hypothetical protein
MLLLFLAPNSLGGITPSDGVFMLEGGAKGKLGVAVVSVDLGGGTETTTGLTRSGIIGVFIS